MSISIEVSVVLEWGDKVGHMSMNLDGHVVKVESDSSSSSAAKLSDKDIISNYYRRCAEALNQSGLIQHSEKKSHPKVDKLLDQLPVIFGETFTHAMIKGVLSGIHPSHLVRLQYQDEEGDAIDVDTDGELVDALRQAVQAAQVIDIAPTLLMLVKAPNTQMMKINTHIVDTSASHQSSSSSSSSIHASQLSEATPQLSPAVSANNQSLSNSSSIDADDWERVQATESPVLSATCTTNVPPALHLTDISNTQENAAAIASIAAAVMEEVKQQQAHNTVSEEKSNEMTVQEILGDKYNEIQKAEDVTIATEEKSVAVDEHDKSVAVQAGSGIFVPVPVAAPVYVSPSPLLNSNAVHVPVSPSLSSTAHAQPQNPSSVAPSDPLSVAGDWLSSLFKPRQSLSHVASPSTPAYSSAASAASNVQMNVSSNAEASGNPFVSAMDDWSLNAQGESAHKTFPLSIETSNPLPFSLEFAITSLFQQLRTEAVSLNTPDIHPDVWLHMHNHHFHATIEQFQKDLQLFINGHRQKLLTAPPPTHEQLSAVPVTNPPSYENAAGASAPGENVAEEHKEPPCNVEGTGAQSSAPANSEEWPGVLGSGDVASNQQAPPPSSASCPVGSFVSNFFKSFRSPSNSNSSAQANSNRIEDSVVLVPEVLPPEDLGNNVDDDNVNLNLNAQNNESGEGIPPNRVEEADLPRSVDNLLEPQPHLPLQPPAAEPSQQAVEAIPVVDPFARYVEQAVLRVQQQRQQQEQQQQPQYQEVQQPEFAAPAVPSIPNGYQQISEAVEVEGQFNGYQQPSYASVVAVNAPPVAYNNGLSADQQALVEQLNAMGFSNNSLNIRMLQQNNWQVEPTMDWLLTNQALGGELERQLQN